MNSRILFYDVILDS